MVNEAHLRFSQIIRETLKRSGTMDAGELMTWNKAEVEKVRKEFGIARPSASYSPPIPVQPPEPSNVIPFRKPEPAPIQTPSPQPDTYTPPARAEFAGVQAEEWDP